MKKPLFIIALLVFFAGCNKELPPDDYGDLRSFLPPDSSEVEVFTIGTTSEMNDIIMRFQRAIQSNQDWWLSYTREHLNEKSGGKPLPYHENMGITKDEYKLMQSQDNLVLMNVGKERLVAHKTDDGKVIIQGSGQLEKMKDITINLNTMELITPFGKASNPTQYNPQPEQKLTGPCGGYSWRESSITEQTWKDASPNELVENFKDIRFYICKIEGKRKGLINYKVKITENGVGIENFDLFAQYYIDR